MSPTHPFLYRVRTLVALAAFVLALVLCATPAHALDRVTLKEGNRVIEGTIIKEIDGIVWIRYKVAGIEQVSHFSPDEIAKVERDSKADTKADTKVDAAAAGATVAAASSTGKTPKAVVITLGDRTYGEEVGVYFTAHALREAIPTLEKELGTDKSGVVVFRIYSGGGLGSEVDKMWDVIRNDYMKRWRCVAWIEAAISAAAMTAHCMEEIYFTSQANYGACTGWYGSLIAVKGYQLEVYLEKMRKISLEAGHDPLIMRSMQIQQPLSATILPDGSVKFYADTTSGDILVNREHEILTLNAVTAAQIKFSKGTADTLDELARLMGYKELDWVGENVKGIAWPVCKAERMQIDFRKKTKADEERLNDYFRRYQTALSVAQQIQNKDDRAKAVGKAREAFEDIKRMMKNNPYFMLQVLNTDDPKVYQEWVEKQEKLLRELLK